MAFFGVNFILQKFCQCKKNKYQVWFKNSVYPGQPNFPYIFSAADFEHKTRKGYGGFQCKGHLGKSKEGVLNKDRAACS